MVDETAFVIVQCTVAVTAAPENQVTAVAQVVMTGGR